MVVPKKDILWTRNIILWVRMLPLPAADHEDDTRGPVVVWPRIHSHGGATVLLAACPLFLETELTTSNKFSLWSPNRMAINTDRDQIQ